MKRAKTDTWFVQQVEHYAQVRKSYEALAGVLESFLKRGVKPICPSAIVQARAKETTSFAEKILRKPETFAGKDAVAEATDLCGARVIAHFESEIEPIARFVREHFIVDEANSQDTFVRLRASEFGYRGVHLIVELRRDRSPATELSARDRKSLLGLKAEIQIRTIAQHAWSDIGHDRLYKSAFNVPETFQRDAARIAALLEGADDAFSRMAAGIDSLRNNVMVYMDQTKAEEEINRLHLLSGVDPKNLSIAIRLTSLLISLGRWDEVKRAVNEFGGTKDARLLAAEGLALCKSKSKTSRGNALQRGRNVLAKAASLAPNRVEILTYLAEAWKGTAKALEFYEQAFRADPQDPRALAGFLRHRIADAKNRTVVPLVRPSIDAAIRKCEAQAAVGVNLPWAHFYLAEFHLLLDRPYEALAAYTRGISHSVAEYMLDEALDSLTLLAKAIDAPPAVQSGRRLLLLARACRFRKGQLDTELRSLARKSKSIDAPVLIVAGGCDPAIEQHVKQYERLLKDGFTRYSGTVISGGTCQGISGMVGKISKAAGNRIHAIGYLPATLPTDGTATPDRKRYEIRPTDGKDGFSAIEPLQNWIDILASGIKPADVRLLGVNGGTITAFEYRLAAVLGAKVGVLRHSGRQADELLVEQEWERVQGINLLPQDATVIAAFVAPTPSIGLEPKALNDLAKVIHEQYRESRKQTLESDDAALKNSDALDQDYKQSNIDQAADIHRKIALLGMEVVPFKRGTPSLQFTKPQIETLAKHEHGRWVVERLHAGWRYGEVRDLPTKLSPYLVPWEHLPESVKKYDRDAVKAIPDLLARLGRTARRASSAKAAKK